MRRFEILMRNGRVLAALSGITLGIFFSQLFPVAKEYYERNFSAESRKVAKLEKIFKSLPKEVGENISWSFVSYRKKFVDGTTVPDTENLMISYKVDLNAIELEQRRTDIFGRIWKLNCDNADQFVNVAETKIKWIDVIPRGHPSYYRYYYNGKLGYKNASTESAIDKTLFDENPYELNISLKPADCDPDYIEEFFKPVSETGILDKLGTFD